MQCPRCRNPVVQEVFVDYESGASVMSFVGYRCVICGEILDETIQRHRAEHDSSICGNRRNHRVPMLIKRKADGDRSDESKGYYP
jgi:hypothetical protein